MVTTFPVMVKTSSRSQPNAEYSTLTCKTFLGSYNDAFQPDHNIKLDSMC